MSVFVIVNGWLGQDSEIRTTQGGTKILKFSVGADVYDNGEKKTEWYNCSWFGTRAEKMCQYLKKGQSVSVNGTQSHSEFQRKDGTTGYSNNVSVSNLDLMGGSQGGQQSGGGGGRDYGSEPPKGGAGGRSGGKPSFGDDLDDSIPFVEV